MNKSKSLIQWFERWQSCRHAKYIKRRLRMTDKLKEGIFLLCCSKVLDSSIRDEAKASKQIQNLFLVTLDAHSEIFGMETEED
jgi:hypothetical protein